MRLQNRILDSLIYCAKLSAPTTNGEKKMATLLELVRKKVNVWPGAAEYIAQNPAGFLYGVDSDGQEFDMHTHAIDASDKETGSVTRQQWEGCADGRAAMYASILTQGFELPHESDDRANISRIGYELLQASLRAWLSVMLALDETHPDWATCTNKGTLAERAVKAIKNGN